MRIRPHRVYRQNTNKPHWQRKTTLEEVRRYYLPVTVVKMALQSNRERNLPTAPSKNVGYRMGPATSRMDQRLSVSNVERSKGLKHVTACKFSLKK
jgi:hypothetical protein